MQDSAHLSFKPQYTALIYQSMRFIHSRNYFFQMKKWWEETESRYVIQKTEAKLFNFWKILLSLSQTKND